MWVVMWEYEVYFKGFHLFSHFRGFTVILGNIGGLGGSLTDW